MRSGLFALVMLLTVTGTSCYVVGGFTIPESTKAIEKLTKIVNNDASIAGEFYMIPVQILNSMSPNNLHVLYGESICKKTDFSVSTLISMSCPLKPGGKRAVYELLMNSTLYAAKKLKDVVGGGSI